MAIRLPRFTLALVGCLVALPLAGASDSPPTSLKLVAGHWTAWDPPSSYPEGTDLYTVVGGDTFWALAGKYLGNPYLWPQLWEKNQYVRDAHWIYPGDPLVVGVKVVSGEAVGTAAQAGAGAQAGGAAHIGAVQGGQVRPGGPQGAGGAGQAGAAGEAEEVAAAPGSGGEAYNAGNEPAAPAGAETGGGESLGNIAPSGGTRNVPVPLGSEDDIYCSGFIGELDESFGYRIVGSEYEALSPHLAGVTHAGTEGIYGSIDTVKYSLATGDIIYLDGGSSAGLSPGTVLVAVAPSYVVHRTGEKDALGRKYDYLGRVRVLSTQESTAIGEIVQSCAPIVIGSRLKPFEPEPVPLARRTPLRPINAPTTAAALAAGPEIVATASGVVSVGQDHVVFIDRGGDDDVAPGDVFTIYRPNRADLPPVVLGELAVLSVQRHTALAKILESRQTIYIGDRLERK
ncbi:MAG: LysM peptidoglycan-binding domain-containing protein [Thermoanaerobaculia bacterium]